MTPYWLLFGLWLAGSLNFARSSRSRIGQTLFAVLCVLTALMIGLRYQVGGDWNAYYLIYANIYFQPFFTALDFSDPGYAALNWLGAQVNTGMWFPNLVCAILFMGGVGRLAARQPQPWLAMLVAIPYFVIVVAMGYTRQAAAIGIMSFAIADANENNLKRTIIIIAVAALFHKTAILMLPLALGPIALRKLATAVFGGFAFLILFVLLLQDQSDALITNYVQSNYDSQGAAIRIAMNVLAGGVFLLLRKRMGLDPYQQTYWTLNALLTFLSVIALVNVSASSGVDRLALFLIPLQMVALSRLPQALSSTDKPVISAVFGVILYAFAIQFVWLNFATNANSWLPYSSTIVPIERP